jgi:hypothetical protein
MACIVGIRMKIVSAIAGKNQRKNQRRSSAGIVKKEFKKEKVFRTLSVDLIGKTCGRGWWLMVGGWWLVVDGWWLVVGG